MKSDLWQMLATPVAFDLAALARAFAEQTRSAGALIQLSDGARLVVGGVYPPDPAARRLVVRVGQGVTGLVARNGHGMRLGADAPRNPVHRHLLGLDAGGSVARLCVPARGLGGQILGVVGVHRSVDEPYSDDDVTGLQPCADLLGLRLQVMSLRTAVDAHRDDRDRLIAQAISAQEMERRRIASDLHDGVTTALASMSFHLNAAELSIAAAEAAVASAVPGVTALGQARSQIGVARTLADRAYNQTRAAITGLHSLVLDDLGLVAALESLAETAPDAVMQTECDPVERFADLPDHAAAALFRIAQESTSNAIRHGRAGLVTVSLRRVDDSVLLGISDDGVGFDVRRDPAQRAAARADGTEGAHYGLSSIAERCALIGASLRIESMPGRGTTVIVDLPVPAAADPAG